MNTRILDPSLAGMCKPYCAIRVRSPSVLRATVFPPVFGPVIISESKSSPSLISVGTILFVLRRGCLAPVRTIGPFLETLGGPFGDYKASLVPGDFGSDGFFIAKLKRLE